MTITASSLSRLFRRGRIVALGLLISVLGVTDLLAERITNVGLVDLQEVTTAYFRESSAVRKLEIVRDRNNFERMKLEQKIIELEALKIEAEKQGLLQESLRLDEELFQRKQHLRDFVIVKKRQLSQQEARLSESDSFLIELSLAIEHVAEAEGLSVVLRKDDLALLFFLPEIDVTNLVISELRRKSRAN